MIPSKNNQVNSFLLLYASQTGQAQAIAEEIADTAPDYGLKANLFCLSLTDKRFSIEEESCVVFIVSTTGDGESPDTAVKFFRRLNRHSVKKDLLKTVNFSLLALGDSNYIKFCNFGRLLEKRLKELSAKSFYATGYGDDAYGIETGVDPWIKSLWPALQKHFELEITNSIMCDLENENSHSIPPNNKTLHLTNTQVGDSACIETTIKNVKILSMDFDPEKYRVPKLPIPSVAVSYEDLKAKRNVSIEDAILHSQASSLIKVNLSSAKKLTFRYKAKETLELTFSFEGQNVPYEPGDAFGFICHNPTFEVQCLLERLKILEFADHPINICTPDADTRKKKLPSHIPLLISLREIFLHYVDIRTVPKKILLRVLAEHCADEIEKKCLLYLSSQKGSKEYTDYLRVPSLNILDILLHYPSCDPPVEALLEYLPSLKPRFYSVSSSPLEDCSSFKIVFNTVNIEIGNGRLYHRKGICTGWFKKLSKNLQTCNSKQNSICEKMSSLSINNDEFDIYVYKKQNNHFHLPKDINCPTIMIGPGTGVSPFVGFLQHRKYQLSELKTVTSAGSMWLFYGCRTKDHDFLFKTELYDFKTHGVLSKLSVSHSREDPLPEDVTTNYVHENIRLYANEISKIISEGGYIFVCGDAKHMAQDVQMAFIDAFSISMGMTAEEAKSYVQNLQNTNKYINDVWT